MLRVLFILLFSSNLHASEGWSSFVDNNFFPDSQYLQLPWRENSDFVIANPIGPENVHVTALNCPQPKLWPTHPSQASKEYLWAAFTHYDHFKLPIDSYACLRPNPTNRFCVMAAIPLVVVMSDLFEDECGNLYRGYWLVSYFKSDENMGTLYSKGRTSYPRPDSPYEYDMIEGDTYPVEYKDFLFLGELMPLDHEKISQEQARAIKNGFIRKGKAFLKIN